MGKKFVSIVIPIYNEEKIIKQLYSALESVIKKFDFGFEAIFVNDGSSDNSLAVMKTLLEGEKNIKIIDLSRNFGQQLAVSAGLDYAGGDAVIVMDADMEDNPQDTSKFIEKWLEGYDVVYAIRSKRKVSLIRKFCFAAFHSLNKFLSEVPTEPAGIFCLMDRKVVEKINDMQEKNRFIPGLRSWVGFRQIGIELKRDSRYDSKSRVTFIKLISLAFNSYFSFSKKPLRLASILGIIFSAVSFLGAILIIVFQLIMKFKVPGWASIVAIILLISGMQFICLGIMGEYIGRIFDESKRRPLYIVNDLYGFDKKQDLK